MRINSRFIEQTAKVLASFLEGSQAVYVIVVESGGVSRVNAAMADLLGHEAEALTGVPVADLLTDVDADRLTAALGGGEGNAEPLLLNFIGADHMPQTLTCRLESVGDRAVIIGERVLLREDALQEELLELTNSLSALSRENARKGRELEAANRKLQKALDELDQSYWHLRKIQEVLPICMECGRVNTTGLSWESVADYLRKNSLFLSHGVCPDCAASMRRRVRDEITEGEES